MASVARAFARYRTPPCAPACRAAPLPLTSPRAATLPLPSPCLLPSSSNARTAACICLLALTRAIVMRHGPLGGAVPTPPLNSALNAAPTIAGADIIVAAAGMVSTAAPSGETKGGQTRGDGRRGARQNLCALQHAPLRPPCLMPHSHSVTLCLPPIPRRWRDLLTTLLPLHVLRSWTWRIIWRAWRTARVTWWAMGAINDIFQITDAKQSTVRGTSTPRGTYKSSRHSCCRFLRRQQRLRRTAARSAAGKWIAARKRMAAQRGDACRVAARRYLLNGMAAALTA